MREKGKRKKGVCTALLTIEDLVGLRIEIVPEKELSSESIREPSKHISNNVPSPKIPKIENINQPVHVVSESTKKTHESEKSRKSLRVRKKNSI